MKRWLAVALGALVAGACAHMPKVRPGPPMHVRFAPPDAFAQLFTIELQRESFLEFPGRETIHVKEHIRTTERETFERQSDGGYLVTSMLLDEEASRDGMPVQSAVPLKGVPFVTRVDAKGRFLKAEGVGATIDAIEANAPTKALRELIAPLLTPEVIARRIETGWRGRTEGLCNTRLTPGQTFFGVDSQELPAGGPALSLVKATVIGRTMVGLQPAAELWLEFGGASSKLAREPGAQAVLASLPKSEELTGEVQGEGRRYVALDSCQELAEEATLDGAWTLNRAAAGPSGAKSFPARIRFHLKRKGQATSGAEAAAAEPMP